MHFQQIIKIKRGFRLQGVVYLLQASQCILLRVILLNKMFCGNTLLFST